MKDEMQEDIWKISGTDIYYKFYRKSERSADLRSWVNQAHPKLTKYLDNNFISSFRKNDFYGRLWELEFAEFLINNFSNLRPKTKVGPDFCLELDGNNIWIEAVLPKPDRFIMHGGKEHNELDFPAKKVALRYTSVLHTKAEKIKRYIGSGKIHKDDYVLIATSGIQLGGIYADMAEFMRAILPIEQQLVYFSQSGEPLESILRPTHTISQSYTKNSGSPVTKEFIYPGTGFSFIDGVIFSEASNLQQLLGTHSSSFSDSTNHPHLFQNHSGKQMSEIFRNRFYSHEFKENGQMVSLETIEPSKRGKNAG